MYPGSCHFISGLQCSLRPAQAATTCRTKSYCFKCFSDVYYKSQGFADENGGEGHPMHFVTKSTSGSCDTKSTFATKSLLVLVAAGKTESC